MNLAAWQWALLAVGAFMVGVSKTGMAGISILFIAIFTNVLPARLASGLVLPMLIVGDVVAVSWYRQHAQWKHLWKLFPWTGLGVILGYLTLGKIDDHQTRQLVGAILLFMVTLHFLRKWWVAGKKTPDQEAA
ncbi:MAG TPA: sulfite exporter TauE/SafE family protein, partial [Opitutaceae bacterium]|nr:sulfite exporter TauE/SafE family protein [Opitutaceae bacterium]